MAKKTIIGVLVILLAGTVYAGGGSDNGGSKAQETPPEVVKDLGAYDTSWDDAEFCTLIIPLSVVVTSIDGSTVDWGLFQGEKVKVAIPAGTHTLLADYSHPLKLQSLDGTESSGYSSWEQYQRQEQMRQAQRNMQSSNSATRTAGQVQGAASLLGSLFSLGKQAAADAKAKKIQQENDRRVEEARRASNENIEMYQRFAPGGVYELEVVPNSAGPYHVQIRG